MTTETQMPAHSEGYGTEEPQASPQQRDEPILYLKMLSEGNRKLLEQVLDTPLGWVAHHTNTSFDLHEDTINRLLDAARAEGVTSLEAELKRAREALKPFARTKVLRVEAVGDSLLVNFSTLDGPTAEDFQTARAALQPKEPTNAQ